MSIPSDLTTSTRAIVALATRHGVTSTELDQAEARAMWTLAGDRRLLSRLGARCSADLPYAVQCWAVVCLAVQAELVAIFAGQIGHVEATHKAAALVRRAARSN